MDWLLRKLGFLKNEQIENEQVENEQIENEQIEVLPSRSWLSYSLHPECIRCEWLPKTEALNLVRQ